MNRNTAGNVQVLGAPGGGVATPVDASRITPRRLLRYPKRSTFAFLTFLAFVVARYVQLGARRDFLAAMRFEFILGLGVIFLAIMAMADRQPSIGQAKRLLIAISALFFAMIIQLPFAADPEMAWKVFNDRVIKFAFLTFLMIVMIESPSALRLFIFCFLFSIFYITLESVRGLMSGGLFWENQGIMRLHGAVPIYRHPNSLGGVAMGAIPFVAFLFPRMTHKLAKLGLLALTVTSMVCVVYSGSRTAYIGLLAFVLWWFVLFPNKIRFLTVGFVAGFLVLSILPKQYIERFESIGGKEKQGNSKGTRVVILQDAMTIFQENPFGVGVASFPEVRRQRFGRVQDTHNLYLEVATNLGIQGLIVFLALVAVMMLEFRRVWRAFQRQRKALRKMVRTSGIPPGLRKAMAVHDRDLAYLIAVAQATGGFIFIRLALGLFGMDLYEVYWWFGAGLAIVLSGLVATTGRHTRRLIGAATDVVAGEGLETA